MKKNIKCKCCGLTKEIEYENMQSLIDNGFDFIYDISNGLTTIILCNECVEKIKYHIHAIEDILNMDINLLNFGHMSKFN
jgi:hypothetical protein